MEYRMHINSEETVMVYNINLKKYVEIIVGNTYTYDPQKPTTIKDRKNKGRIVKILGFSSDFMGDAIVRYTDTKRRGRVKPNELIPYIE